MFNREYRMPEGNGAGRDGLMARDIMTRGVCSVHPYDTVCTAAKLMDDLNIGALPVCNGRRIVGMITDRDITIRATAAGLDPLRTPVADIMSEDVRWCYEDDDAAELMEVMGDLQIRRIPVISRDKRLVGIVALGDLATDGARGVTRALRDISLPSEPERSSTGAYS